MSGWGKAGIAFVAGFAVAALPLGVIVARAARNIDIRRYGTGNIGAYNVWQNVGLRPAAFVAVGTFLQGLLPPLAAGLLFGSDAAVAAAAVGAVLGYAFTPYLAFRGGRAIGVSTGAATALYPPGLLVLLACYGLGALSRRLAPGVLVGLCAYVVVVFVARPSAAERAAAAAILAVVLWRRLEGVRQDLGGTDSRAVFLARLIHDRRPGQRLSGPMHG